MLTLCLLLGCPVGSRADEVRLKNGDRLTGEIVKLEEGTLTLKTSYGGSLALDWTQVEGVTSDKPLTILLQDRRLGPTLDDPFGVAAEKMQVHSLGPQGEIPLDRVKAINRPTVRYDGTLSAGGNLTGGNTDTAAFNGATRWTIRTDWHRVLLEGKYNYAEVGNRVTARNSLGSAKYDFFVSKHTFLNAEALFEKDTFQSLVLRSTYSVGVGYQFLDTDRHKLAVVGGLSHVSEDYSTVPDTETPSLRWGVRWEYALVPDMVKLFHKHEGYQDFMTRSAVRFFADQGVRVAVYQNLFLNFEFDLRYNGAPAPGRKPTDEAYIFGLGYALNN